MAICIKKEGNDSPNMAIANNHHAMNYYELSIKKILIQNQDQDQDDMVARLEHLH